MEENIIDKSINNLLQDRNISGNSSRWANWMSELTIFTCKLCVECHGMIVDISILDNKQEVNAHPYCKCVYVPMRTKIAGTATEMGYRGADAVIIFMNELPSYYLSKKQAREAGWQDWKGNLNDVLPGKMIGGDVYKNREGKLPNLPAEFGMRLTLTMKMDIEIDKDFYTPMMGWYL